MILPGAKPTNLKTDITKPSSNRPILGIEALLGLVALNVRLQGSSSFPNQEKNTKNEADKDGEICLTKVPPRPDTPRAVDGLAANTASESQTPNLVGGSTIRATPDSDACSQHQSTSGGS